MPFTPYPGPIPSGINTVDQVVYYMQQPFPSNLHEAGPNGVPTFWSWGSFGELDAAPPPAPSNRHSMTLWGQIYLSRDEPAALYSNVRVELRSPELWVLRASTNQWQLIQHAIQPDGAHYFENFANNSSIAPDWRLEQSGGRSSAMVSGYNLHFWALGGRADITGFENDIIGIFSTVQARLLWDGTGVDHTNDARYVCNMGADWWQDLNSDFGTNTQVAESRFGYVLPGWKSFSMHSRTDVQLRANPPTLNFSPIPGLGTGGTPPPPTGIALAQPTVTATAVSATSIAGTLATPPTPGNLLVATVAGTGGWTTPAGWTRAI